MSLRRYLSGQADLSKDEKTESRSDRLIMRSDDLLFKHSNYKERSVSDNHGRSFLTDSRSMEERKVEKELVHSMMINSTSCLIMNERPDYVQPKSRQEQEYHMKLVRKLYDDLRRENEERAREKIHLLNTKSKQEDYVSNLIVKWKKKIIPFWSDIYLTAKVQNLWWEGLPTCIRSIVWRLACPASSDLNETLILEILETANWHIKNYDSENYDKDELTIQESAVKQVIYSVDVDINRTFPRLNIFQTDGPLYHNFRTILVAYCCHRKDVGYIQGMSFIVATLLLNLEPHDAFFVFCSIMNDPVRLGLFSLKEPILDILYKEFDSLLYHDLPKLYNHFKSVGFTTNIYLIDWLMTMFTKHLPLDVSCRLLDIYFRDGEIFLFRTALGLLKLQQTQILLLDFFSIGTLLTTKKESISEIDLFDSIATIQTPRAWFNNLREDFYRNLKF